jgi:hypothetical protein
VEASEERVSQLAARAEELRLLTEVGKQSGWVWWYVGERWRAASVREGLLVSLEGWTQDVLTDVGILGSRDDRHPVGFSRSGA